MSTHTRRKKKIKNRRGYIYESQQAIDAMRVRIMTISIYNRARRYYPGGLDRLASTAAHNPLVTDSPT